MDSAGSAPAEPPPIVESAPAPVPPVQQLLNQEPQVLSAPQPAPYEPIPMPEPAFEAVIKTKSMQPQIDNQPAEADFSALPAESAAFATTQPRVIMPEDAPETARKTLAINPFPQGQPTLMPAAPTQPDGAPPVVSGDMAAPTPVPAPEAVVGFGSDMPLALALQQVAPPGYAFSFGESINPGAKVSWTGGKSWVDVMQDMIVPLGLKADIRGKIIFVYREQHSGVMPQIETLIEPAAGDAGDVSTLRPEDMVDASVRRSTIHDPGSQAESQPEETVATLDERTPTTVSEKRQPKVQGRVWEAEAGDSLKQVLQKWGKAGDFNIDWQAMHDFTIQSDVLVAGRVDMALKTLVVNGLGDDKKPAISFVKDQDGAQGITLVVQDPQSATL